MKKGLVNRVETIRRSLRVRTRADGGEGSGNWGHIGRPGHVGGSTAGGGNAFRMTRKRIRHKQTVHEFTSQSKIRREHKEALKAAKAEGRKAMEDKTRRRMQFINMNIKSADPKKAGKSGYQVVNKIDLKASKNILADPDLGKKASENSLMKVQGTKAAIEYTFPNRTTRGGSGARGGKTKRKRAKV